MKKCVGVVVNPRAASGRVDYLWPQFEREMRKRLGEITVRETGSPGHATGLARELIDSGHDLIVAVGGDGTVSEVAGGMLHDGEPVRPGVQLGFLPLGTGSDFRRTLGLSKNAEEAIDVLARGTPFPIDVGRASFTAQDGRERWRYFVNLVSFGMGGEVAAGAKTFLTALGGRAAFLGATLRAMATYKGRRIELELDGDGQWRSYFISNVAIGNGQYHGGGMRPCPGAAPNDGVLDVTVIDHLSRFEILRDIRFLYSGNVYRLPKVHQLRVRSLRARAEEQTLIELDGEPLGALPIKVELLPRKLTVLVSPLSPLLGAAREPAGRR